MSQATTRAMHPSYSAAAWLEKKEEEMMAAGFQRGQEDDCWTASAHGMMVPGDGLSTQLLYDRIRIFRTVFFGERYTKRSFLDRVTVEVFEDVPSFLAWCRANGQPAVSLPPYAQGFD